MLVKLRHADPAALRSTSTAAKLLDREVRNSGQHDHEVDGVRARRYKGERRREQQDHHSELCEQ